MPIQSSGAITLNDLQTFFGGSNPIGLSEYYKGAGLVPNVSLNSSVPTSGAISLSNFYSAVKQVSTSIQIKVGEYTTNDGAKPPTTLTDEFGLSTNTATTGANCQGNTFSALVSTQTVKECFYESVATTLRLRLSLGQLNTDNCFSQIQVGSNTFLRSAATYASNTWTWTGVSVNPFGAVGSNTTLTVTSFG